MKQLWDQLKGLKTRSSAFNFWKRLICVTIIQTMNQIFHLWWWFCSTTTTERWTLKVSSYLLFSETGFLVNYYFFQEKKFGNIYYIIYNYITEPHMWRACLLSCSSALWKESPPFHCWFLRNVWSFFILYLFIYCESSAVQKKPLQINTINCTKIYITLFFWRKKLYNVRCFPIWRKGAVLQSVSQKSVFYNLTPEEPLIDLFVEDSTSINMFDSRFCRSFIIKSMYNFSEQRWEAPDWFHPLTSVRMTYC